LLTPVFVVTVLRRLVPAVDHPPCKQVAIFVPGSLDSLLIVQSVLLLRFIRTAEKIVSLKRYLLGHGTL
jgi:hypothetical protein